jgi:hypothetical protein
VLSSDVFVAGDFSQHILGGVSLLHPAAIAAFAALRTGAAGAARGRRTASDIRVGVMIAGLRFCLKCSRGFTCA